MYEDLLKPCPLCGHQKKVSVAWVREGKKAGYIAECYNSDSDKNLYCGCVTKIYKTPQEAIRAWNNRVVNPDFALKPCPLCGSKAQIGHFGYAGEVIDDEDMFAIRCSKCHFCTHNGLKSDLPLLVDIWNSRTD